MKSKPTKVPAPKSAHDPFSGGRVLLVGDVIVDRYREGEVLGVSAETPTLVAKETSVRTTLGGAGLVMRNIASLGSTVTFITLVGNDEGAGPVNAFSHPNAKPVVITERGRITTVKDRFWVAGQKLLGWDRLDNRPAGAVVERKILALVTKHLAAHTALVISDYRHGLISERLAKRLVALAVKRKVPVIVDSQISQRTGNHLWYRGATTVCLNRREAASVDTAFSDRTLGASLRRLKRALGCRNVVVKLGERGSVALLGATFVATEPLRVDAKDSTGAGDAFLAVLAAAGVSKETLRLANAWAALSTTVIGTEPPARSRLTALIPNKHPHEHVRSRRK